MRTKALIGSVSCAILFFGLAMYLTPSDIPTIAPVRATTKTISLVASYTTYPYWNNSSPAPTITVTKGDTVNIMLSSDGSQHKLLVDFDGDGPSTNGCTTVDQCSSLFMSTTSISFVANIRCQHCGFLLLLLHTSSYLYGRTIRCPKHRSGLWTHVQPILYFDTARVECQ